MLFNSFIFLIFFPIVTIVYFILPHKVRWFFLLTASYYFYMNWKPVYAMLIFTSTMVTWVCSVLVQKADNKAKKKIFLILSLIINFSILFVFKYFNFLNESLYSLLEMLKIRWEVPNLDILLPVGISFYTFQAVGYTIDVYRGNLKAEKNFGIYALFVSFFPQLVAGPIERAKNLLPQFHKKHNFDLSRAESGIKQMIWGYFMKVVVADRLALFVNAAYNNVGDHNGTTLIVATVFFTFQIYCDFAGYSNIAIGAARIMGFDLMTNFNRPYFAINISEFWQRWHISLSTWFRDYLYIPLGGNKVGKSRNCFNIFITFIVSGIWHGANWTFIIWGTLHGIFNIIQRLFKFDRRSGNISGIKRIFSVTSNFVLVVFAWIIFRANSVSDAFTIIDKIFTEPGTIFMGEIVTMIYGIIGLSILIISEFHDEFFPEKYKLINHDKPVISALSSAIVIIVILSIGVFDGSQFIYFQF